LLDRIDIHLDVPAVKFRELTGDRRLTLKTQPPFDGA
jgi:hypothetical protein